MPHFIEKQSNKDTPDSSLKKLRVIIQIKEKDTIKIKTKKTREGRSKKNIKYKTL